MVDWYNDRTNTGVSGSVKRQGRSERRRRIRFYVEDDLGDNPDQAFNEGRS
jgi:hypothetical protein